jgi:hypothetical protein
MREEQKSFHVCDFRETDLVLAGKNTRKSVTGISYKGIKISLKSDKRTLNRNRGVDMVGGGFVFIE